MRTLRGPGRRIVVGIASAALTIATATAVSASPAPSDPVQPAEDAAGWLEGRFVAGERIETTFDGQTYPDWGLTADAIFALAGTGVAGDTIGSATDWLQTQVGAYTGDGSSEVYAGPTAKLVLVAETTGRDARQFGGRDLVGQLHALEDERGRFSDASQWGDYSNAITQSLAVIALERATDTGASDAAVSFLADAACDDGGIPEQFGAATCTSAVDATGFAVQAFLAAGEVEAADAAVDWLLAVQRDDGSFGGGGTDANTNSTGLAAVALAVAGEQQAAAAAAAWLGAAQFDCAGPEPGALPYTSSDEGDLTRSTAQALPGLTGVGLSEVTTAGAQRGATAPACPFRFDDVDYRSTHARAIAALAEAGIIEGRRDGSFAPAAGVTRAQLATFIGRAAGIEPAGGATGFSDVPASYVHAGYIKALAEAEVINGYPDGSFRPTQVVRRDQAAALIARWLELSPVATDRFTDVAGLEHRQLINALADAGVARGTGSGATYSPARTLQRDQIASLLYRAVEVVDAP
ncbi:S-layer homology domain-containing protein [Egicoccus sp. AB-alg6-2]|uniref:S-layer homology domain-containing protein n=1 Tax=Egicoccus sp. AB-alg6-2 TaxID=3242692 RepID=UPI00359E58DE